MLRAVAVTADAVTVAVAVAVVVADPVAFPTISFDRTWAEKEEHDNN